MANLCRRDKYPRDDHRRIMPQPSDLGRRRPGGSSGQRGRDDLAAQDGAVEQIPGHAQRRRPASCPWRPASPRTGCRRRPACPAGGRVDRRRVVVVRLGLERRPPRRPVRACRSSPWRGGCPSGRGRRRRSSSGCGRRRCRPRRSPGPAARRRAGPRISWAMVAMPVTCARTSDRSRSSSVWLSPPNGMRMVTTGDTFILISATAAVTWPSALLFVIARQHVQQVAAQAAGLRLRLARLSRYRLLGLACPAPSARRGSRPGRRRAAAADLASGLLGRVSRSRRPAGATLGRLRPSIAQHVAGAAPTGPAPPGPCRSRGPGTWRTDRRQHLLLGGVAHQLQGLGQVGVVVGERGVVEEHGAVQHPAAASTTTWRPSPSCRPGRSASRHPRIGEWAMSGKS